VSKSPAEKLLKAEKRARKAARRAAEARRAMNLAAGTAVLTPGPAPSPLPAPDAYDEHLMAKAAGGDEIALQLLRKRGTDGVFASYARHVLAKSTDPGQRAYAAGVLAQLDEDFDEYAPQPRPAGSAW
jgi:hypothetical protein